MFQALFSHHREAPACTTIGIFCVYYVSLVLPGLGWNFKPGSSQLIYFAHIIPIVCHAVPPDDEQIVLETCKGC
jgi:hypothetical protein